MTKRSPSRIDRVARWVAVGLVLAVCCAAEKKNEAYQLHIHRARGPIVVDGSAHEPGWDGAEVATNFWMVLPMDTGRARVRTDVRMAYDDRHLYLSAICYNGPVAGPYMVESRRRDWSFSSNDNFIFFLDTFDDQANGFTFGVNAVGAQWDGLLYDGGKANLSWDNQWTSAVKSYPDRYELEIAIPFKTIRYKKGNTRWGVNFSRLDLKSTEKSSWTPIPRQFPTASLALTGVLLWDEPPPAEGPNVSLIPYALGGVSKNFEAGSPTDNRLAAGLDAKVAIGPAMNLDLTANPDFSQVEVDQQVQNFDRYELFYPEKRQFFLENGDQFANFGYAAIRPFFSRRIGLGGVPIRFGARLSGKPSQDWRFGLMDIETGAVDPQNVPAENFAVMAVQRRLFSRSNVGMMLVDKETTRGVHVYNRNFGAEYNLASADNTWTGKLLYLKSFTSGQPNGTVYAGNLQYNTRRWLINGQVENVSPGYGAEAGYVPRTGFRHELASVGYTFLPSSGPILSHGPSLSSSFFLDWSGRVSDHEQILDYTLTTRSSDVIDIWTAFDYVRLLKPYDATTTGRAALAAGTVHQWYSWGTSYTSRPQRVFRYGVSTRYGGYYANGTRLNLTANLGYRIQPTVSITGSASYNDIRMPQPWGRAKFWLIGPKVDVTLTNTLYLTAFVQYNEQQRNLNTNTRIQWRYKPASDIFLVWTDDYLPEYLQPGQDGLFRVRNRAIVLKWTYWWNF